MAGFYDVKVGDTVLAVDRWNPETGLTEHRVTRLTKERIYCEDVQPGKFEGNEPYAPCFLKYSGESYGRPHNRRLVRDRAEYGQRLFSRKYQAALNSVNSDDLRRKIIELIQNAR